MSRVPEPAELADDIAEIKTSLIALVGKLDALDAKFVPRELYDAKHGSLRGEISTELARLRVDLEHKASRDELRPVAARADAAFRIGWGVLILLAGVIVTALVGFLTTGGTA